MFSKRIWMGIAVTAALVSGCTGGSDGPLRPERRLSEYISLSFAVDEQDDRARLEKFLTGDALSRFRRWNEEEFKREFIDSKREFVKIAFPEVNKISENEVNITYVLTYVDHSRGQGAKITNKKLCHMVRENGMWMVHDVRNIKELIEYRNELSLP